MTNFNRPQAEVVIDERDRRYYFAPSRPLFSEHCKCIINRYGLYEGLIRKEKVQDIKYDYVDNFSETDERVFTVHRRTRKALNLQAVACSLCPLSILHTMTPQPKPSQSSQTRQFYIYP